MKLSSERKAQTGAYYTPDYIADYVFDRFAQIYGDQIHRVTFYDPTAGEGALLEPFKRAGCRCLASSLESEDVQILRAKGIKAYQMDLLADEHFPAPLMQDFAESFHLCIVSNPPYFSIKGERAKSYAVQKYLPLCSTGQGDASLIIITRVLHELPFGARYLYLLLKGNVWASATALPFRSHFPPEVDAQHDCFHSALFGTRGEFAIDGTLHNVDEWTRLKRLGRLYELDSPNHYFCKFYPDEQSVRTRQYMKESDYHRVYVEGRGFRKRLERCIPPEWLDAPQESAEARPRVAKAPKVVCTSLGLDFDDETEASRA